MEIGTVKPVDIDQEMRSAYLDYAMSVIVARALPDARDGLKPVQRRILFACHDMGMQPDTAYKKSARIVGEVLGKYHPHGDSAVYDAMARMAQDFSLRYPLVDGQGNFGSVDGDRPAAMRYTEARLDHIATELLLDIEKDTVDWVDNFDGTLQEPSVLPARLPNLLVNGSSGIAVGMATNVPPHNLGEVCDALDYLIDRWDELDEVTVEDLMQYVKGPDFPTGGIIVGREGIAQAYATGRGRVVVRAMAHIEEMSGRRHRIVITELPYQTNKSSLMERIATLARSGRLDTISDLRDESDRRGMSIIIELKRSAQPRTTLNQLFKYTPLQSTFGVQMLALVEGEPRLLSLRRALQLYIEHRLEVVTRRTQHELEKARHRAHILEGLKIAFDHLDAVIQTIRQSPDTDIARERLMERFELAEIQAQAILDMQLRRLAALERQKIEDEYLELIRRIAYLEDLLASPRKILYLVKAELADLKQTYADGRRTRIVKEEADFGEEDLVVEENVLISITQRGYIKRVPLEAYRARRGGRGVIGMTTHYDDAVLRLFPARTLDSILFFSNRGKVYQERVYQIPSTDRTAKGVLLAGILPLDADERITAVMAVASFEQVGARSQRPYLTMFTHKGRIKRIALSEFSSVRPSGLIAIRLDGEDELGWVSLTSGEQDVIIVTQQGQALRFNEKTVRVMGRNAAGVNGIKLDAGDRVCSAGVVARPDADLLIVTTKGYGKRTVLSEFSPKGRYGRGVRCLGGKQETSGVIAAARVVQPEDEVMLISSGGMVLRTPAADIPQMGRATRGVKLMELKKGDELTSVAVVSSKREAVQEKKDDVDRSA
ncbi:MAG: DNA gyrase subunit A [Chloroflexi bacterium]|nr:DNA gyrase subunit A [Chloroflexota bacterium]